MSEVIPANNHQRCNIGIYGENGSGSNRSQIRFCDNSGAIFFTVEFCNLKYNDSSIIVRACDGNNGSWQTIADRSFTNDDILPPASFPYKFTVDFKFKSGKAKITTQAGRIIDINFPALTSLEGMTTDLVMTAGTVTASATIAWTALLQSLYLDPNNTVWGYSSDNTFSKLSDNWSALTDPEKVSLFTATKGEVPTVEELKTIGTKFKVLSYAKDNNVQTCVVSAVPKDQIILPSKLINLNAYETVHSISMTSTVTSDTASVKVAFTKDLTTYIAYDKATATWVNADVSDTTTFASSGMDISEVANIPEAKVNELGMNGFAVALLLSKTNVSDNCTVSALTIIVDKKAPWNKAVYGTDYTYGYPNTDVLEVKLLTNGSYKINYHAGESSD